LGKIYNLPPPPAQETLNAQEKRNRIVALAREVGNFATFANLRTNITVTDPPREYRRWGRRRVDAAEPIRGWQLDTNGITPLTRVQEGVPIMSSIKIMLANGRIHGIRYRGEPGSNAEISERVELTADNNSLLSDIILYGAGKRPDAYAADLEWSLASFVVTHNLDIWTND